MRLLAASLLARASLAVAGVDGALELLRGLHDHWRADVARLLPDAPAAIERLTREASSAEHPAEAAAASAQLMALNLELGDAPSALAELARFAQRKLDRAPQIDENSGAWANAEAAHMFDASLAAALQSFAQAKQVASALDLGCGMGRYVSALHSAGIRAVGYDGNPDTRTLTQQRCFEADLTRLLDAGGMFDLVLSLEVAEHIPAQHEPVFVDNLCRHVRRWAVVSWSTDAAGFGHVNPRSAEYVRELLAGCGLAEDAAASAALRAHSSLPWFRGDGLAVYAKVHELA